MAMKFVLKNEVIHVYHNLDITKQGKKLKTIQNVNTLASLGGVTLLVLILACGYCEVLWH